jgi:hypothetical protein
MMFARTAVVALAIIISSSTAAFALDVHDSFDSAPPNPDAARNDVGVVASFGWSYRPLSERVCRKGVFEVVETSYELHRMLSPHIVTGPLRRCETPGLLLSPSGAGEGNGSSVSRRGAAWPPHRDSR